MTPQGLLQLIQKRRSIYPPSYVDKPIPKEILEEILEAANWAPNHRKTEPWRFKVIRGGAKERLGQYMADFYKANTPEEKFSPMKFKKNIKKTAKSDTIIAICMKRDPADSLPEWEEEAAVAMAVQNMWLMCTAHSIGSYWSSGKALLKANDFLGLEEGEKCMGAFFMGYYEVDIPQPEKASIMEKVEWLDQ
ncbi:MAG: nitroreductase [Bacteroidota bacterium]